MPRPLDETAERTLAAVRAGLPASESELWNAIRHLWKHGRLQHGGKMTEYGEFHPGMAANVIAAVLTARGVPLLDDGALAPEDLAAYLARA